MNTDNKQLPIKREVYESMLQHAVAVIEHARLEIAKHINGNIASAYWEIGKMLHERKVESGHGDGVVRQLSVDLKERYPKMGLSPRQLWNMKKFYIRYAGHDAKVLRAVALLPWYCESTKAFVWGKRQEVILQIEECSSLYIENSPYHLNTFL